MPGIPHAIAALRARSEQTKDVVQGIVTGNYALAAPLKLRACGIDPSWFAIGAFGDEGRTRPDLVALALARCKERFAWSPAPRRVRRHAATHRSPPRARMHRACRRDGHAPQRGAPPSGRGHRRSGPLRSEAALRSPRSMTLAPPDPLLRRRARRAPVPPNPPAS